MSPQITSRQNPRIKQAASLRNRKQRRATGQTLIDGPREVLRALAAGVELTEAYVCQALLESAEDEQAIDALESACELLDVSRDVMARIAYGDRADGVVAVARVPERTLGELKLPKDPLVAVVEGVEKPGNLGALLRSADGGGVDAVIVADPVIDLFSPNAIRASVGTVFKSNIAIATTAEVLPWLAGQGLTIFAARPDATQNYSDANYKTGTAIALGNEATGLTDAWASGQVTPVRLPMRGIADSLNLSATAAVLFYEALRQRS